MSTPTAAGTRPGGAIAGAWAVMNYLGVEGYREKARLVCDTRAKLMAAIDSMPGLRTYGKPQLGLFIWGADDIDPFKIYGRLLARGWFSGLVTEPRGVHLMLSPAHAEVADQYIADVEAAAAEARNDGNGPSGIRARYA
ncbi:MAG: aspartate aminotransferase family protein, partial [Deltaproteobacteria bacterium]|nr:aspartate aminotransferase family protein [Deltaproteobacteria bacterium]